MKKTVYQLLNEVETDFTEYEKVELSSEETDYYKQKILAEVKNMKRNNWNNKSNKRKWIKGAGIAAALAVAFGAAGIASNPVLAEQIFSDTFGKILGNGNESNWGIGGKELTTKVAGHTASIQEELEKRQDSGDFITTVEDNGVMLSVSDVYCDGYSLYYTLTLTTEREDLNQAEKIWFLKKEEGGTDWGMAKIKGSDGEDVSTGGTCSALSKVEDGLFVAMEEIVLHGGADDIEDGKIKGELQKMNEAGGLIADSEVGILTGFVVGNGGEETEVASVEGNWNLKFPVTINFNDSETIEINQEKNGILLKNIVKTKTSLLVNYALTMENAEDMITTVDVKDKEGNYLANLGGGGDSTTEGGYGMSEKILYDGQKDLVIEVVIPADDENPNIETIAEFEVQIP